MALDYQLKAAEYCNKIVMLPGVDEDKKMEMIEEAFNLFIAI